MPEAEKKDDEKKDDAGRLGQATAWLKGIVGLLGAIVALFALYPEGRKAVCGIISCPNPDDPRKDEPKATVIGSHTAGKIASGSTNVYLDFSTGGDDFSQSVKSFLSQRPSIQFVSSKSQADYVVHVGDPSSVLDPKDHSRHTSMADDFTVIPSKLGTKKISEIIRCDQKELGIVLDDNAINNGDLQSCLAEKISDRAIAVIGMSQ